MILLYSSEYKNDFPPIFRVQKWSFTILQSTNGALKTINSSRLTVDPEGNLFFSNVTRWEDSWSKVMRDKGVLNVNDCFQNLFIDADFFRLDTSQDFLYACSASSFFRNEYKLGNRVFLQVISHSSKEKKIAEEIFRY